MKKTIAAVLAATLSLAAQADESCGLRVARLLSTGQTEQLSSMFAEQPGLLPALEQLAQQVGALSAVQDVSGPRFKKHRRLSVGQASGLYAGSWVNATSEKLGAVQLHIAQRPGSACALLALHVDSAQP